MKRARLLCLFLAMLMALSVLAGCQKEDTPEPAPQTTTTGESTTQTNPAETTTSEPIKLGGYEFLLGNPSGLSPADHAGTKKEEELKEIYAAIEEELDCKINFNSPGTELDNLLPFVLGGTKAADFLKARSFAWMPLSVRNGLHALDTPEMLALGLNVYSEDHFNQFFTSKMELNGHIWCVDVTGKYMQMSFGHVYTFNKRLVTEAGYNPSDLYQAVRDGKWTYDLFLEIARKITKDTDGDGKYDIWGVALDCDGNEIYSNGVGPIVQDESGKWVANLSDPRLIKAMEFMNHVSGDPQVQLPIDEMGRGDRRTMFYEGKAGFAGLYGPNFGKGGTHDMADPVGLLPIPKGPDTDHYMMNLVNPDCFVLLTSTPEWEKSVIVWTAIADKIYNPEDYRAFIEESLHYDEESIEMMYDYLLPNALLNVAKCSRDMHELVRNEYYDSVYKGNVTPAAAAEAFETLMQAELDNIFQQQ